ncbi:N-acetylneuraminate synthase family protein [Streptomyces enissocaesilis]|uniref:N-acetylneuraminate synthase n=1 Tax=Streptomyces enissocaesilis TaxID=332589 RepID=A0ABP6K8D3_9ACTN
MREITIGNHRVADDTDTYVIAEIGHNHEGSLDKAVALFRQAAAAGAQAVKLQKRDNQNLFVRSMFDQPYEGRNSYGPTYGRHREALEFGHDEFSVLVDVAEDLGIDFFSTAFDIASVDFLMKYDLPAIKIASADLTNTPLLEHAATTQKPLIVSTGGADMDDVRRAVDTVLSISSQLVLLQCTAVYPAAPSDLNLAVIETYRQEFPNTVVGFSGHDLGPEASWIAHALGARVVEKHFTLDQYRPGSDHHYSLDPVGLQQLTRGLSRTREAIGVPEKVCAENEAAAIRKMGKKLVAARRLPAGTALTAADVAVKSPGDGLKPYQLQQVVGRTLTVDLEEDADIRLDVLQP